jgi:iron(III) transport system ATP-binding protein
MPAESRRASVRVTVEAAVKRFEGRGVLNGVGLDVEPGAFFTLLGPSGCGKTTLLRAIAGYHPLDAGQIRFDSRDVTALPPWERHVGFVFQNYALWPDKTVFENVAYGLRVRRRPEPEIKARVGHALDLVRLSGVEGKAPGALSGGMQQRAALARALVVDPPVLLFDEPLSNLDAALRVQLRRDIRAIQRDLGTTAVYVTHDQEEALEISDRIGVMLEGRIAQIGDPETIYARPEEPDVARFVGTANLLAGQRIGDQFVLDGAALAVPMAVIANAPVVPDGAAAVVLVRPEWFVPAPGGAWVGRVLVRHYKGHASRYDIELPVVGPIVLESADRFAPGEIVALTVGAAWIIPSSLTQQETPRRASAIGVNPAIA